MLGTNFVWVQDDGIGKKSEGRNRAGTPRPAEPTLGVVWSRFRGPGRVDVHLDARHRRTRDDP